MTAEFERYKRCGILERGFVRLYCKDCLAERVIGFSCKGRGFYPSCVVRRALQKAEGIEREVWPRAKAWLNLRYKWFYLHAAVSIDGANRAGFRQLFYLFCLVRKIIRESIIGKLHLTR